MNGDFDFSKPPKNPLQNAVELRNMLYTKLHEKRSVRFKVYSMLQELGHCKISQKEYAENSLILEISEELIDAINSGSKFLQAYVKMII